MKTGLIKKAFGMLDSWSFGSIFYRSTWGQWEWSASITEARLLTRRYWGDKRGEKSHWQVKRGAWGWERLGGPCGRLIDSPVRVRRDGSKVWEEQHSHGASFTCKCAWTGCEEAGTRGLLGHLFAWRAGALSRTEPAPPTVRLHDEADKSLSPLVPVIGGVSGGRAGLWSSLSDELGRCALMPSDNKDRSPGSRITLRPFPLRSRTPGASSCRSWC